MMPLDLEELHRCPRISNERDIQQEKERNKKEETKVLAIKKQKPIR
jgi:hypothetical protein